MNLAELFDELVRFETELWNAVDARLRADFDLPLAWFEPMQIVHRVASCRVYDIASELSAARASSSTGSRRLVTAGEWPIRTTDGRR